MNRNTGTAKQKSTEGKVERKHKANRWKSRFLHGALIASIIGSVLWVIAMSTNYWVYWVLPPGDGTFVPARKTFLESQYAGMWQICRTERSNETSETSNYCTRTNLFPSQTEVDEDPETDRTILNYRRAVTAIAIITVFATAIAISFTWYSIQEPRYIFKRLAGSLLLACAGCIIVCIETYQSAVLYEKLHLASRYPPEADHRLGFSFGVAWVCFALHIISGLVLFVYSGKNKDNCEQDTPVINGRV